MSPPSEMLLNTSSNHDLQRTVGDEKDLYLEPVMWETHANPALGNIQDNIFAQVGDFDVFVGFFWQRFGTPTGEFDSGSEAEFYKAYELWQEDPSRPVLMYFCNKPYPPSIDTIEQIGKVLQFKKEIGEKGLYREYRDLAEFKDMVRVHVHRAILGLLGEETDEEEAAVQQVDPVYRTYLDRLRRRCRLLPLAAFGFEHGAEDDVTLDQVYINLDTTARKKVTRQDDEEEEVPVSALEAVGMAKRTGAVRRPRVGQEHLL